MTGTGANTTAPLIIKKYANRRLYDTKTSKYITLEDVREMVRREVEFEVRDAKTDEDLTRLVLAQIILEQEGRGVNLLPLSFLRQLICFYDDNVSSYLPHYLEVTMKHFSSNQDAMREAMERGWKGFSMPLKAFEDAARQNMELFQQAMQMLDPFTGGRNDKEKKK